MLNDYCYFSNKSDKINIVLSIFICYIKTVKSIADWGERESLLSGVLRAGISGFFIVYEK